MALDEFAKKYAQALFNSKSKVILNMEERELEAIKQSSIDQGLLRADLYIARVVNYLLNRTNLLSEAKADSELAAYEKAGVRFDDVTLSEVTSEILDFCYKQQHRNMGFLAEQFAKPFLNNKPPEEQRIKERTRLEQGTTGVMEDISEKLRIRRYETALDERRNQKVYASAIGKRWDVFISHASEDKKDFVEPLARALEESGLGVWYDKTALTVGDTLRAKIDEGLARSRYGVVVLSHAFFAKKWPQQELEGLFTREIDGAEGVKVILPVWHNINYEELARYSPMLAGRFAADSRDGLPEVVTKLREAMGMR